jgi:Zn-finger nucleic acid-binding protein
MYIFQCGECLGLWVDGEAVVAISEDSALEAEAEVSFEEISTKPRENPVVCPRCDINLMEQSGGGLPQGLHIDYCRSCCGYWFDKGELMIYKAYLEDKRRKFRKHEEEKRRRKAAQSRPAPTQGETVLRFLNQKVPWYHMI